MKNKKVLTDSRQVTFIKKFLDAFQYGASPTKIKTLIKESGFSATTAQQVDTFMGRRWVRENLEDFIDGLDDKRKLALSKLTSEKMDKSNARDLTYIIDSLTKNHQLLSGEATQRSGQTLSEEQRRRLAQEELRRQKIYDGEFSVADKPKILN